MALTSEIESKRLNRISARQEDKNILTIGWDLSSQCNYRCSYCDPSYNGGQNPFPQIEKIRPFLDFLRDRYKDRYVILEIKGGEPTIWKGLPEFLEIAKKNEWYPAVVSNGSASLDWWAKNGPLMHDIALSFHPERASIEHFTQLITLLSSFTSVTAMILMYPPFFEQATKAIVSLRESFPNITIRPVAVAQPLTDSQLYPLSPEQQMTFKNLEKWRAGPNKVYEKVRSRGSAYMESAESKELFNPEVLKVNGLNKFKGWSCHAGLDRLHISTTGYVFRGQCLVGDTIGSIYDSQWNFPDSPVTCTVNSCFCGPEVVLEKWSTT